MIYAGVDGCRAGWIAVFRRGGGDGGGGGVRGRILGSIEALSDALSGSGRVLIDMPIGLPWAECPVRPCDRAARRLLGSGRRSSVFPPPCREALAAANLDEARRINRAVLGRSIAAQTWNITAKIAELDRFLQAGSLSAGSAPELRESHPEVCFRALDGRRAMAHRKSTHAGREERLSLLRAYLPEVDTLLTEVLGATSRRHVSADDVLDAAVLFVAAEERAGRPAALSGEPAYDRAGLPMEIVYPEGGL
ncbi:MAG: DUF429 domain-containing protein [Spirochaetota bacterium]